MKYTFSLILTAGGGTTMEAREMCANWDDVVLAFKRNDYDGVVRTFTTKFEFVGDARSLLISKYLQDGMRAAVSVSFRRMGSDWQFSEVFASQLDFTTLSYDDTTAEISAVDNSAAALIKAKRSTQFTIPVLGISPLPTMNYIGVPATGKAFYTIPEKFVIPPASGAGYATPRLWLDYDVLPTYGRDYGEFAEETSVTRAANVADLGYPIWESLRATRVRIIIDVTLTATYSGNTPVYFRISTYNRVTQTHTMRRSWMLSNGVPTRINADFTFSVGELEQVIPNLSVPAGQVTITPNAGANTLAMTYYGDAAHKDIYVARPREVMQRLLQKMGVTYNAITIDGTDARMAQTYLFSGDMVNRGLNGNIVTSWADFEEWMSSVFGYVCKIEERQGGAPNISFVPRSSVFGTNETNLDNYKDFSLKVQSNLAYSKISAGYNKEEKDSSEFANEFLAGALSFSTGITNNERELKITTKYKCAPYIIEEAIRNINPNETGSSDMYFIGLAVNTADLLLQPIKMGTDTPGPTITGCGDNEAVFNAMYNQREMIKANWARIAPAAGLTLTFADFEGNNKATVDGYNIAGDFHTGNLQGIYSAAEFSIDTDDNTILSDWGGIFNVWNRGKIYRGYLKDVSFTIAHPESVKYTFILKEID